MNKTYILTVKSILFICIALCFSCQEDNELSDSSDIKNEFFDNEAYHLKTQNISELKFITKFINEKANKNIFKNDVYNSKDTIGGAIFDESNVLALIDSLNNTKYAFHFTYPETPENIFYNLIVGVNQNGELQEPYILKYIVDEEALEEFVNNQYDFRRFSGSINQYPFGDFFIETDFFGRDCTQHDQYGDPIPCQQSIISNGVASGGSGTSSGSGSSGSTSGTGSTGGGTGGYNISISCACNPHHNESQIASGQCSCNTIYVDIFPNYNRSATSSDCPECIVTVYGSVPINTSETLKIGNLFEETIVDTNLKPCLKNILTDLKNIKAGVGYIITKFAGNNPGFNWEVKYASLGGQTGQTSQNYNKTTGTVTTSFDSQAWKKATDLSWARTILHEGVHAYIVAFSKADPINTNKTFPDLMKDMLNRKYSNWNDAQHAEIVRNYVNDIALSLQSYGTRKGYSLPNQFYSDLAWCGLTHWTKRNSAGNIVKDAYGNTIFEETPWFKTLVPSLSDRNRINNVISIELNGKDINGNTQTPKGSNAGC